MSNSTEELRQQLQAAQRALAEAQARCERHDAEHMAATKELEDNRSALLFMLEDLEAGRKKTEQAYREWMAALDMVDDPIFLHDRQFCILRCNKAYQQCAGIPFKQIIGQPYYEVFPKNHAPMPCCLRAMKKAEEEEEEEEEMAVGGAIYRSRAFSIHDEQGAYLYSMHILEDITEHKQAEAAFRALVGTAAANIGAAFFHETVSSLCTWLGVECVILGELVDENRVRTLAMQLDGKAIEHYEYALPGTPCNNVAHKGYCEYPEGVCQLFPSDQDLADMGAEAYVGTPIRDKNGKAIGILCAISRHKLVLPPMTQGVFEIIAARAGTEIERKRAEDALIESEEKFRKIGESAQDAIIMMADKRISFWNAAAERIFGFTAAEALGQELHALIVPEPAHIGFTQAFPHFRQSGEGPIIGKVVEVTALRKGGEAFPVELSVSATQFGGQWHAIGIVRDITERKRAEGKLHESEKLYRSLFENMLNGFAYCRMIFEQDQPQDFIYLSVNAAFETLTGLKNVVGRRVSEVIPGIRQSDPRLFEIYGRVSLSGRPERFEIYLRALQQWFWISVYSPEKGYFVAVFDVITERKKAEQTLEKSEAMLSEMGRMAKMGGWEFDARTGEGTWTEEVARIHDMDPAEATSLEIGIGFYQGESRQKIEAAIKAAIANGTPYDLELEMITAKGNHKWVRTIAQPVKEGEKVVRVRGSFQDITAHKQAEIAIEHANRALATLSEVNRGLVYATEENELLQAICQAIVKQRTYRMAWVGYKQHDENKSIKIMAHAGHDEGYLDAMQLTWAESERGMGPSGRAIRSGATQLCQDIANDLHYSPWRDEACKRGFAASIALPLLNVDHTVFGVLNVYTEEVNAFTPGEISLLEEMARDLASGVRSLQTRRERDLALEQNWRQLAQLQDNLEDTVRAIASIAEMRDPYTAGHQARVADLAAAIARQMGLPEEQVHGIHLAGVVHDLGKIKIPAEILSKPGKISDIELNLIKAHPQAGYDILQGIDFTWPIAQMVLQHHERLDGSGYPQGLKGDAILLEARILSVADVVEAMSSRRPYRPGLGIEVALEEITKQRGSFFDPQAVDACLAVFREQGYSFK